MSAHATSPASITSHVPGQRRCRVCVEEVEGMDGADGSRQCNRRQGQQDVGRGPGRPEADARRAQAEREAQPASHGSEGIRRHALEALDVEEATGCRGQVPGHPRRPVDGGAHDDVPFIRARPRGASLGGRPANRLPGQIHAAPSRLLAPFLERRFARSAPDRPRDVGGSTRRRARSVCPSRQTPVARDAAASRHRGVPPAARDAVSAPR